MRKKQSILIITFCIPWPVADGGKMYVYTSVNYLRRYYNITLLLSVYNKTDEDYVAYIRTLWPDVTIEVVNYIKQLSTKAKLKRRLLSLYQKLFLNNNPAAEAHVFFNLRKKISNIFLLSPNFLSKCETLFANNTFDLVQVEYSTNIGCINFIPEKSVTVYVEIESLYSIMEDFLAVNGTGNFTNKYLVKSAKHIEIDFMRRYDALFTLNGDDHKRISQLLPGKNIFTSPFAVPNAYFSELTLRQSWKPEKIIYLGSESHYPNKDAVEWYAKEISPLVNNTTVQLYITGTWSETFKASLAHNKHIIFTGFIEHLSEIMTNSILIVPIRLGGGGIRAKIIQAMAFGIPIVATPLACAGIVANDDSKILMRDEKQGFADAVSLLLQDHKKGLALIEASFKTAEENYAEATAGEVRHAFYQQLLQNSTVIS